MCILFNCVFAACAAALRTRGGASPPLANHPRRGMYAGARDRKQICPHTVEKFDLRQRRGSCVFSPDPGGGSAGDVRPSPVVSVKATLRPGAGMRARGAHPYRGRSVWRARVAVQASLARRVVAPYEVAAVNGTRASGVASIPLTLTRQMGGSRKASLTLARAARPEGRGGDSQEAGGTLVPPPLVCLRRTAANMPL